MFPSISLNNSEKQLVSSALPSTSQVHHGAICRLYKTNNHTWEKRLFGAALILTNTDTGSHYIELVDLKTRQICFTQQLYNNFTYNKSTNYFHTFETNDGVVGLSFANEPEAERFYQRVQHCAHPRRVPARPPRPFPPPNVAAATVEPTIPQTKPPQLPIQTMARPKVSEPIAPRAASPIMRSTSSETRTPQARASMPVISFTKEDLNTTAQKKEEEKPKLTHRRSFIRDLSNSFKDLVSHKHKEKEMVISGPTDFRHVSRIGFNPEQGTFEISNIPPEWRQFFAGVGIKKSDLKNKETATMVMNIIDKHNSSAPPPIPPRPVASQQTTSNPPPIPPRRATVTDRPSNTPPPIPPRRSTVSNTAAPSIPQSDVPPVIPPRPRMAPPPVPSEEVPLPPPMPPVVSEPTIKSPAESPSARSRPLRGADFESQLNNAKLKHVEQNASFKTSGGDLASTLMRAMEERRNAIREDVRDFDSDDDDWDL